MSNSIFHLPRVWLPRIKFSVTFSLRKQRDADVGSLMACVTQAGKRFRYAIGFDRIPIPHWDTVRQRMYPRTPRANEVNAEIDRHLEAIILFYSSSRNADAEQPTLDGLKAMLFTQRVNAVKRVEQEWDENIGPVVS